MKISTISISELSRVDGEDIVVNRGQEVVLAPDREEYVRYFHEVEVRSFTDLQALHFIPEGLDEAKIRTAITKDDAEGLALARTQLQIPAAAPCGCHGGHAESATVPQRSYAANLRSAYTAIRRAYHPYLAEVLSEHYGRQILWDDLLPKNVRGWTVQLERMTFLKPIALKLKDITIQQNATLSLTSSTSKLWANDIRIHVGGKLNVNSSYIKIRCHSVQGNLP